MKKIKIAIWNKEHKNVLEHGNLKTDQGKHIFSTETANKLYPGSVKYEHYIEYTWKEYLERGIYDAESYDEGSYAMVKILDK